MSVCPGSKFKSLCFRTLAFMVHVNPSFQTHIWPWRQTLLSFEVSQKFPITGQLCSVQSLFEVRIGSKLDHLKLKMMMASASTVKIQILKKISCVLCADLHPYYCYLNEIGIFCRSFSVLKYIYCGFESKNCICWLKIIEV